MDELSKGDRTKWKFYLDMNIVEFFNELARVKDKRNHVSKYLIELIKGKSAQEANVLLLSYLIQKL